MAARCQVPDRLFMEKLSSDPVLDIVLDGANPLMN